MTTNIGMQWTAGSEAAVLRNREDLWSQAALSLKEQDRVLVNFLQGSKLDIVKDVLALAEERRAECLKKRWKLKHNGKVIILRDVFEKLIKWINSFMMIGDVAIQFDPGHAALPWAGVRFLLQWTINDSQIFGTMIEGLEITANLIARYSLFETLYLQSNSSATDRLKHSLVSVYASILTFLGRALHFYDQNTAIRFVKSLVKISDTVVEQSLEDMRKRQSEVERDAQLVVIELEQKTSHTVGEVNRNTEEIITTMSEIKTHLHEAADAHTAQLQSLYSIMDSLMEPIFRIGARGAFDYQDGLEKMERLKALEWLSLLPYPQNHDNARTGRLVGSGQWMLQKSQFKEWCNSSYSSILWLHGIPGSGKTKLASIVIDELLQRAPAGSGSGFAYFYCARDPAEPNRANPLEILRCIARQLSSPSPATSVQQATLVKYKEELDKGFALRRLNFNDTLSLILELTNENAATIVIDALDECDPESRHELFKAIGKITQRSSNIVKVFVTSRDDGDIVCHLEGSPNIYIDSQDNAKDINRFIAVEIEKAIDENKLLHGNVSDNLKNLIINTLQDGAQGMFRWVSLQLQNLCNPYRMKLESDIRAEIGRLPKTLFELYTAIYDQIEHSGENSRRIGRKALTWVFAANSFISTKELICLITVDEHGSSYELSVQSILDLTCNLLVLDPNIDTFRFAHLSVREYLEGIFDTDSVHVEIAQKCLEHLCVRYPKLPAFHTWSLHNYAHLNWGYHCSQISSEIRFNTIFSLLSSFLFDNFPNDPHESKQFTRWRNSRLSVHPERKFYMVAREPFATVCECGFSEIIRALRPATTRKMSEELRFVEPIKSFEGEYIFRGMNGLHISSFFNQIETIEVLLEHGVQIESKTLKGKTPLHIAAERGNVEAIKLLLSHGANPHATTITQRQERPITHGLAGKLVRPASSLGFRNVSGGYESVLEEDSEAALHYASYSGSKEAVKLLLDCGAEVDVRSSQGATPLHKALEGGREEIVQILLNAGADANSPILYGRTPLHFAAGLGQIHVASYLLKHGADPKLRDVFGNRLFEVALRYGYNSIAEMLKPEDEQEITLDDAQNWLLDFKADESNLDDSSEYISQTLREWKELPVRNKMLQDIAARKERERRFGHLTSHFFAPQAS
ncbi:hypothetical protein B7463_g9825, partial [Scytalidium lignicola]